MELMHAIQLLKLNTVSSAWVNAVWDCEFTDIDTLDPTIEEELREDVTVFKNVYKHLLPYSSHNDDTQSVWNVFGENDMSVKSLVAVLACFIHGAKARSSSVEQRRYSLQAASLYLLLVRIPGSIANKVFHQILFDTCLEVVLKCWPQSSGKKRKKDTLKSSQGDAKSGKRAKPPKKVSEEIEDEEEDEEDEVHFSDQDMLGMREDVAGLVRTLLRLLEGFSLKDKPHSADSCVRLFTELSNFEPVSGRLSFTVKSDVDKLQSLPDLAYRGLWLLCSSNHGEGNECRRRVFHHLLYVILMMKKEGPFSKPCLLAPSQAVCSARDQAILFISHVVDEQAEATLPLLMILLQHICHQMIEKAEYRASGAQAVGKLMTKFPCYNYAMFVKWLYNYSLNTKVAFRMFALDVAVVLLTQEERQPDEALGPDLAVYLSHRFLVHNVVYGRRSDISPTVRAHSMHCLAQCLDQPSRNATKWIQELFSSSPSTGSQTMTETGCSEQTLKRAETGQKTALTFRTIELTKRTSLGAVSRHSTDGMSRVATSVEYQETMELFRQRVSDPKTNVRKCALEIIMSLLKHGVILCTPENMDILSERCRDPAVSVKKKAMQCVMDLLTALPDCAQVQEAWLRGVVPAVMDSESSVQEKALECLNDKIFACIKSQSGYRHDDASQRVAWDLLRLMCDKCLDLGRYFSKALSIRSRQEKFSSALVNSLIWHTEREHAPAAWLLLAKVAGCCTKLNLGTILEAWETTFRSPVVSVSTTCHILTVLGHIAASLNDDTKSRITDDLMAWLKGFGLPLEVIGASVDALFSLGQSDDVKETMRFLNRFCGDLVSVCEEYLSTVLLNEKGAENLNQDVLVKHLYTLGVASLHCPAKVQKRVFLLVQSILTTSEQPGVEAGAELPASQPLSQFKPSSMPTVVRAHAVITLGKLCLQHQELMLRYIPAFARELEVGTELAVRSNVVVVLCDLCVRYPNTLTRYINNISACLRDPEPLIREQSLIMLTNLLQEEFIKWKGSLFFRFVAVLVDPDPTIADLCEYCLVDLLLKKNPLMFSQHFIECIFHFNAYEKHKKYNRFAQTESEKSRFSLKGHVNQGKRFRIYRFLLKHFTDEQRFNITTRISQDVLACFVDSELPLDPEGAELLADVFDVLSLKEIKLMAMSGPAPSDDAPEDDMAAAKAVLQKKLVSQVQKKNFVENVIPMVVALKNMLEEKRLPVLKHLMAYLQVTMQDYRSEVKELFAADEQLAAEVEYNLKMFEKQKEQEELEQQLHSVTLSPRTKGSAAASPAPGIRATPLPPQSAQRPSNTPKSALRLQTFAGTMTPVGRRTSRSVMSSGCAKGVYDGRAISTPQESINEVTFGEQFSTICCVEANDKSTETVLHLMSPEHEAPAPRQWNVVSPVVRKTRSRTQL